MFTCGNGISPGGIHDNDSPLAGGIDIHVINTYTGPSDHGKLFSAFDDFTGNFGRAPDSQPIKIFNDAL